MYGFQLNLNEGKSNTGMLIQVTAHSWPLTSSSPPTLCNMILFLFFLAALAVMLMASIWWMECPSAAVTPAPPDPAFRHRWPTTLPTTVMTTTQRISTCGSGDAAMLCCPTMAAWWAPSEPWWYWSLCWRSVPQTYLKILTETMFTS